MDQTQVRNVSTFRTPILASRAGKPVNLLAVGDQEGKSPVYLTVDADGQSQWESLQDVRIIDIHALPPSQEQLNRAQAMETTGTGTSRR